MWICLNDSFLSIVTDNHHPDRLLVRARRKGDIQSIFPDAKVQINRGTDYKYRARIQRIVVSSVIADRILNIDYDNFKDSVDDQELHDGYFRVWSTMYKIQK